MNKKNSNKNSSKNKSCQSPKVCIVAQHAPREVVVRCSELVACSTSSFEDWRMPEALEAAIKDILAHPAEVTRQDMGLKSLTFCTVCVRRSLQLCNVLLCNAVPGLHCQKFSVRVGSSFFNRKPEGCARKNFWGCALGRSPLLCII